MRSLVHFLKCVGVGIGCFFASGILLAIVMPKAGGAAAIVMIISGIAGGVLFHLSKKKARANGKELSQVESQPAQQEKPQVVSNIADDDAKAILAKRASKLTLEPEYEIVGLAFENRRSTILKHLENIKTVELVREPNNEHDKNAIACIWTDENAVFFRKKHLGYISRDDAKALRKYLDIYGVDGITASVYVWLPDYAPKEQALKLFVKPNYIR